MRPRAIQRLRRTPGMTPLGVLATVVLAAGVAVAAIPLLDWAVFSADWRGSSAVDCSGDGACWVFIRARLGQLLYGFYPEAERWRVDVAAVLVLLAAAMFAVPRLPRRVALGTAAVVFALCAGAVLLKGGVVGLPDVPTRRWGGLMLTVAITLGALVVAFPLGILLALGRRSSLPVIRALSVAFIELWRGVPLITVLFMASVMLPLFLPEGTTIDKLLRAMIGVALFASAYVAEVVRGGLQAVPRGQAEAAAALGLGYWQSMAFVILPQALRHVIPGLINTVIGLFKDTTLVLIIGMFDFLGSIQAALTDPEWLGFTMEGYVFAGVVYWTICFALSKVSQAVERRGPAGQHLTGEMLR